MSAAYVSEHVRACVLRECVSACTYMFGFFLFRRQRRSMALLSFTFLLETSLFFLFLFSRERLAARKFLLLEALRLLCSQSFLLCGALLRQLMILW